MICLASPICKLPLKMWRADTPAKSPIRGRGRTLDVTSILDGSITAHGDKIRCSHRADQCKDRQKCLGSDLRRRSVASRGLQNQISTDVAYRLKLKFDPNMEARLKRQYSTNPPPTMRT